MIEYGCRPEHARAVHLGIASHNLFDVAYGLVLREERGVEAWVEFEMLEGMANHQARAVQARAGGLLLYAPVVRAEDFHSAIAYLVRRLDENTAPDNFLRHVFGLEPGSPDWDLRARSLPGRLRPGGRAVGRAAPHPGPRGRGARRRRRRASSRRPFANEPDTDWALAANRDWIDGSWRRVARAAGWRRCRSRSAGELVGRRGAGRGARPLAPGARGLSPRAGRPRAGEPRARRRARRAAGLGRRGRRRSGGACSRPRRPSSARRRGDLIGAMIVDGAKTVTEADPEVSEAIDFARYYAARPRARAIPWTAVGSIRSAWSWWRRPGTSRCRSRPAACWRRWPRATRSLLKPAPRPCWSAGTWPRHSGRPASRERSSSSCPCPDDEVGPRADHRSARRRGDPHRLGGDGAAVPRVAARICGCSRRPAARTRSS